LLLHLLRSLGRGAQLPSRHPLRPLRGIPPISEKVAFGGFFSPPEAELCGRLSCSPEGGNAAGILVPVVSLILVVLPCVSLFAARSGTNASMEQAARYQQAAPATGGFDTAGLLSTESRVSNSSALTQRRERRLPRRRRPPQIESARYRRRAGCDPGCRRS
jgi:hypothetical protein